MEKALINEIASTYYFCNLHCSVNFLSQHLCNETHFKEPQSFRFEDSLAQEMT